MAEWLVENVPVLAAWSCQCNFSSEHRDGLSPYTRLQMKFKMRGQKDVWKAFYGFRVLCIILISAQRGWINYLV